MSNSIILAGPTKILQSTIEQVMLFHQLLESKDLGTIYAGPTFHVEAGRRFKPQIELFFLQDPVAPSTVGTPNYTNPTAKRRKSGVITFRIMENNISKGDLTNLGTQIKNTFMTGDGYTWEKGKDLYSYTDWDKGYQLQLLCRTKTQAKDLVQKVLAIQGHTPTWKYFAKSENEVPTERYPEEPPTETILGDQVKLPQVRGNVTVRFQYAAAHLYKLHDPVVLCDRSGKKPNPLVT